MPKIQSRQYRSPSQSFVADGPLSFKQFVPNRGPTGGRNVIDGFELVIQATDITQAATAVEGEDLYRMWKRIRVNQVGGITRWNLRGDESRVMLYMLEGAERVREHADMAVAANQNLEFSCYIPMTKRFAKRGTDFALPADLFEEVLIECASLSEVSVGGGTTTVTAAVYYVIAHTHEEHEVQIHVEDVVGATNFPSTAGCNIKASGRLQDLIIFARGANGGAAASTFTSLRIDEIMPLDLVRDRELQRPFLRDRFNSENATTDGNPVRNDPVGEDRAVPVLWCDQETKVFDGPVMDDVVLTTTSTLASMIALHRVVKPLRPDVANAVARRYRVPAGAFSVKTHGKTKKNAGSDWKRREGQLQYMPQKGPLPDASR